MGKITVTTHGAPEKLPGTMREVYAALKTAGFKPGSLTLTDEEKDLVLARLPDLIPEGVQVESIVIHFGERA